jgi:hypothetical protein
MNDKETVMKVDVHVAILYAVALVVGCVFVLFNKLHAETVWGAALAMLGPSPIYKSPRVFVTKTAPMKPEVKP